MEKKLNNMISFSEFEEKKFVSKATDRKTTKRTESSKDVLNEDHLTKKSDQTMFVCKFIDKLSSKNVEKVYLQVEKLLKEEGIKYKEKEEKEEK